MYSAPLFILALIGCSMAASIGAGQTQAVEEGGIPIKIDNRSEEGVEVFSDGNGVTIVVGSAETAAKTSFTTPWGDITLINGGTASLNMNFNHKHAVVFVGLKDGEVATSE